MLAAAMTDSLRVLTAGSRYLADDGPADPGPWPALVAALQARGDTVRVLTTDDPGPAVDGVDRALPWFWADGRWRRPARLEASRIARHGLLQLGHTLQGFRPQVVVWAGMGGLPLTLVGASGLPELALVGDDWPVYGPQVDPKARQDGWDPGAVAGWSVATAALLEQTLAALGPAVDPGRVHLDPVEPRAAWLAAVLGRISELARAHAG